MLRSIRKKASALLILLQSLTVPSSERSKHAEILQQIHDFEIALRAMDLLLDDRIVDGTQLLASEKKARDTLSNDPAAIYPLALGVMEFLEATLGFEPEMMTKAHKTLAKAEDALMAHARLNAKSHLVTLAIYPPGTEFNVTYAELTLLNALVMLLQEENGMMEQAKALLKLRRAYQTLDATYKKIKEKEAVFNRNLAKLRKNPSAIDLPGFDLSSSLPEDVQLVSMWEKVYEMRVLRVTGALGRLPPNLYALTSSFATLVNLGSLSVASSAAMERKPSGNIRAASPGAFRTGSPGVIRQSLNLAFRNVAERQGGAKNGNLDQAENVNNREEEESDDEFADASDVFEEDRVDIFIIDDVELSRKNCQVSEFDATAPRNRSGTQSSGTPAPSASLLAAPLGDAPESIVSVDLFSSTNSEILPAVLTIDEFIHLGVQLCFGILQVVLSLIPPGIGRVLSIVGFKGDRNVGLRMLWRTAITARNIHGALALLCLLTFYDGPIQFVDTGFQFPGHEDSSVKNVLNLSSRASVSDAELAAVTKNPNLYTPQLLARAREFFPSNALWVLQEGRMLAAQGQLEKAINLMQSFTDNPDNKIQMEQVEALLTFDRGMFYAYAHDYDSAARDFARMIEINLWSQAVYLFLAGACYLEKWRMLKMGLASESEGKDIAYYASQAEHYLRLAPTYVPGHGHNAKKKKGGIGGSSKQLPFDKFVLRKTKHIENQMAAHRDLLFIDCVGTSLIHEMVYFWNGYNRMPQKDLELLLQLLGYSGSLHAKIVETFDEAMIRFFLQSLSLRQLGKVDEGLEMLETEVFAKYISLDSHGAFKFTKMSYSPYLYPTALYERAYFTWDLRKHDGQRAVTEALLWLKKAETVSDVGDYELSNRTSMRIKAATEQLDSHVTH